jgi:UDP-GlcNAc3NAcA epimerase
VLSHSGETRDQIGNLTMIEPVGYLESLALTRSASLVVTDSGGIQREAYWLGVPCVTVRQETEWTETVKLGANRLVSPETAERDLPLAAAEQMSRWKGGAGWNRSEYGVGHAAINIVAALEEWLASAPAMAADRHTVTPAH